MIQTIEKFMEDFKEEFPCIQIINNSPTLVDDNCFRCKKYYYFYVVIFGALNTFKEMLEQDIEHDII